MNTYQDKSRTVLFRDAVRRLSNHIDWQLQRAFEETGCSCNPLRKELEEARAECQRLREESEASQPFQRLQELKDLIKTTDLKEHPGLDDQAKIAAPFFRVWLFETLHTGPELELASSQLLARTYAEAWHQGWRPKGAERE